MPRNESAWGEIRLERRPSIAYPRRLAARRNPDACRCEAEAVLRELAFVLRATQAVRAAITGREAR